MTARNVWDAVLEHLHPHVDEEDFRRWFASTAYASDSGDHLTVWVPTEATRRHLALHFDKHIGRALAALGRPDTLVRFVVTGVGDDDEDEDEVR